MNPTPVDPGAGSFYRHADLYAQVARANHSIAMAWFVLSACREFGVEPAERGLELACGPALVSMDLVGMGLGMTAIDLSPEMIEIARDEAGTRGIEMAGNDPVPQLDLQVGDMTRFRTHQPVDFVMNLGLNCSYILSNDDFLRHLEAVADSLRPGGLYLADFEFPLYRNPLEIESIEAPSLVFRALPAYQSQARVDGVQVRIQYGDQRVAFDPVRQLFRSRNTIQVEGPGRSEHIQRDSTGKLYFPQELEALVRLSGQFQCLRWLSDYRLSARLDQNPATDRFLLLLRRI